MKAYWWIIPLAAAASGTAAQQQATDPAAKAPAIRYESAFGDYRPHRDEKLAPWREVNDEVGRIGGHVGLFRGAGGKHPGSSRPAAGQPPERGATKAPASGGHAGH